MRENQTIIKDRLADFYDRDARAYHERFYTRPGPYSALKYRQWYVEAMIARCAPPGATILDVGCGPGELLLSLLRRGYSAVGVDISKGMVDQAAALLDQSGFPPTGRVRVGDIEVLDFPADSFDVVVAAGVIEYQRRDDEALIEMRRVLRTGGHLILNVNNRRSYLGMLYGPFQWLKKPRVTRRILQFVKRHVLGRGDLHDLPDRRTHSPRGFDEELASLGLRKVSHNYFHFSPLPAPLDSALPGICLRLGKQMERLTQRSLGAWLAGGYLVMAQKVD